MPYSATEFLKSFFTVRDKPTPPDVMPVVIVDPIVAFKLLVIDGRASKTELSPERKLILERSVASDIRLAKKYNKFKCKIFQKKTISIRS